MKRERRTKLIRIFEAVALAAVVVDLAVYLLVVRPLGARASQTESAYRQASLQLQQRKVRVEQLEQFRDELPAANDKLNEYLKDHVPTRRRVFSDAERMVRLLTQKAGVKLDNISYKLNSKKGEPFQQLGLDVTVEGPFPNLLKFAHSMETADDLVLVRNFSFSAGQGNAVNLRVGGVLYLTP
jgi:Tfp pilus assembly protein PilO